MLATEWRLNLANFAAKFNMPALLKLIQCFLYDQLNPESELTSSDVPLRDCPVFTRKVSIFSSATASYYAPSDLSGVGSMCWEHIWATCSWRHGLAWYDCAFVNMRPHLKGMRGLDIVHVLAFFSIKHCSITYPCALMHWYSVIGEKPDEDTGM